MGECKIVLEKGNDAVMVAFDEPCTMKLMRSRKAVEILGK